MKKAILTAALAATLTACGSTPQTVSMDYDNWAPIKLDKDGDPYTYVQTWDGDSLVRYTLYAVASRDCEVANSWSYTSLDTEIPTMKETTDVRLSIKAGHYDVWTTEWIDMTMESDRGDFISYALWATSIEYLGELADSSKLQVGIEWNDGERSPIYEFRYSDGNFILGKLLQECARIQQNAGWRS